MLTGLTAHRRIKTMAKKKTLADTQFLPRSLARMVWKHKILCVLTWMTVGAGGTAIVYTLPVKYTSQSTILVDSQKIPEKFVTSTIVTPLQDRLLALDQQIMSALRLRKIIQDFNLYAEERKSRGPEEIVELMRADMNIQVEKGWTHNRPGSFRIYYDAPTPALAAAVTNRLASLYIEENLRSREGQAAQTSGFLDTQLSEAKRLLDQLEESVSKYKLGHNGELPEQEGVLNGMLGRLQVELQGIQDAANRTTQNRILLETSLQAAEAALAALNRQFGETPESDGPAAPAGVKGSERKPSEALALQIELLRSRYSDQHPEVRRLTQELAQIRLLEQKAGSAPVALPASPQHAATPRVKAVSPEAAKEIAAAGERVESLKAQIRLSDRQLQDLQNDRGRVVKDIQTHQARLNKLPVREQEMAALMRDYGVAKANYKSLQEKKLAAEMASDMERRGGSESFTVVEPAEPPVNPSKPNRPRLMTIIITVAIGLGLILPIGIEAKKATVLGEWEIPAHLAVLGRIPEFSVSRCAVIEKDPPRHVLAFRRRRVAAVMFSILVLAAACAWRFISNRY
jgi:polysaccharide chain length determinant protein (PEP-CTERM system associated)